MHALGLEAHVVVGCSNCKNMYAQFRNPREFVATATAWTAQYGWDGWVLDYEKCGLAHGSAEFTTFLRGFIAALRQS